MGYIGVNDPLEAFIVWYLEFRGRSQMATLPPDTHYRRAIPFSGGHFSGDQFSDNQVSACHFTEDRFPETRFSNNEASVDRTGPLRAVDFLISAVSSKIAAAEMTNRTIAQQIISAAEETIETFLECEDDDICPPWPYPGPPPWLTVIAAELTFAANSLQEGSLQTGILQLAAHVMDRAQALSMGMPYADMKHAHAA